MLQEGRRYVCIDFETTGLDTERDEAIQVWIVAFDHTGKATDTFSSYIKPKQSLNELKDIVRVVTGLSIDKLANAPSFDAIKEHVAAFFDEKTVIIWHNIMFDISILKQYMPVTYLWYIDTFPLAQSLIPFSPSYALEVLDKSLAVKHTDDHSPEAAHHDALYDAYATKRVFLECINRITSMSKKYPETLRIIHNSHSTLQKIITTQAPGHTLAGSVPLLTKVFNTGKKQSAADLISKENLPDKGKYYIGNSTLKEVLIKLPKENVIYAFSQRHKTQIAKQLLHDIGLTHIDTGVHHTFDKRLLTLFFQKNNHDEQELYFALKYYFHAFSEHSTIDLNSTYDRKIYHALKEKLSGNWTRSAELLTHEQLYEKMRDQDIMPYTSIFFFDQDRWYDTHMKWEQKPFDLHTLLQITDSLIYRDNLTTPGKTSIRTELHTKLVIFIGIRQTEVAVLMKDVSNSMVEIDNIPENTYFYKTNLIISQISALITSLETHTDTDDYTIVKDKRQRFIAIISWSCGIMTKLQWNEVRFVVKALHSFLEYSEFQQFFDTYQTLFLSHIKKDRPLLIHTTSEKTAKIPLLEWPWKEKLDLDKKNIYVFSNNKPTSQELLVRLHNHKPALHKVHWENITGWKGKNIFIIKNSSHNIIIWWYDFFLQCISQRINIDKVYTLCINGSLQHIISADLVYYGTITHN